MYEAYFALRTRPFSAIADRDTFVTMPALDDALRNTLACVLAGNGPAVVTGASGMGKTAFCGELLRRAGDRLRGVILGATAFGDSRELWQSMLLEFGLEFTGLTDHEARLRVIEAARSESPDREGVLLIIDEAHRLEPRLLDELWQLTTRLIDGRPVVRLVLSGQLELEERLALPELDALNQHIGAHVILETLTGDESRRFIADQLLRVGAHVSQVFTEQAVTLICRAGDGNRRALNQLCDHSLLLAFVEEEKPVTALTVQAALDDLKGLPQHWHESTLAADAEFNSGAAPRPDDDDSPLSEPGGVESDFASLSHRRSEETAGDEWDGTGVAVIEVGGDETTTTGAADVCECRPATAPVPKPGTTPASPESTREFCVEDPYARLDQLAERGLTIDPGIRVADAAAATGPGRTERQILAQINVLRGEIHSGHLSDTDSDHVTMDGGPFDVAAISIGDDPVWDVIEPEPDEPPDVESSVAGCSTAAEPPREAQPGAVVETAAHPLPAVGEVLADKSTSGGIPVRSAGRYALLFTRLKRRRRETAETLRVTVPFADR